MPVHTSTLLARLFKARNVPEYLADNQENLVGASFSEEVTALCGERGLTRSEVIRRAGIERTYGHQLFNGIRKPSRDKALQLAIGLNLSVEETQTLLKRMGFSALYPRIPRDAAILFAIRHSLGFVKTQDLLSSSNLTILGKEDAHER